VEVGETASKEGWTWAAVEACIAVVATAAAAGAKAARQPWPIHGAVGQTGSWSEALHSRSSVVVGNVLSGPRDR
jgi:hypothetical protein